MVFIAHYRTIDRLSLPSNDFFSMGAYGVDIFFVISGFVVCLMIDKLKSLYSTARVLQFRFIISRFIRVIIPLWVAILLQYMVVGNYSGFSNLINSILLIPSENKYYNNLIVYYLEPQWSLLFEFLFYIVLSAFIVSNKTFLYSFLTLLIICLPYLFKTDIYVSNPIILEFIFGMCSYKLYLYKSIPRRYFNPMWLCSCVMLFLIFSFLLREQAGDIKSTLRVFTIGISCFFIVTVCSNYAQLNYKIANNKILMLLGDVSYSLYLTHMVGFRFFTTYIEANSKLALFFIIIFMTTIFYIFVDKPCHILSKLILKND